MEVGSQATPFEHRSFGEELALCQRYFNKTFPQGTTPAAGHNKYIYHHLEDYTAGYSHLAHMYPVEMRTTPSTVMYTTTDSSNGTGRVSFYDGAWKNAAASVTNPSNSLCANVQVNATTSIVLVEYNLTADAEL